MTILKLTNVESAMGNLNHPCIVTLAVMREDFKEILSDRGLPVKKELKNITEYIKELKNEKPSV